MPVENSSRKMTGVSTMNTFASCTRRRKPPLRSCSLRPASPSSPQCVEHLVCVASNGGPPCRESARTSAGCHARQQQLRRLLLDHDDDAPAHVEGPGDHVVAKDTSDAGGRPRRWLSGCAASSSCRRHSVRGDRRSRRDEQRRINRSLRERRVLTSTACA